MGSGLESFFRRKRGTIAAAAFVGSCALLPLSSPTAPETAIPDARLLRIDSCERPAYRQARQHAVPAELCADYSEVFPEAMRGPWSFDEVALALYSRSSIYVAVARDSAGEVQRQYFFRACEGESPSHAQMVFDRDADAVYVSFRGDYVENKFPHVRAGLLLGLDLRAVLQDYLGGSCPRLSPSIRFDAPLRRIT